MGEFAGFQINNDKTFEQVVIKYQINVKMAGFGADSKLSNRIINRICDQLNWLHSV
jgi:hypothetical protein